MSQNVLGQENRPRVPEPSPCPTPGRGQESPSWLIATGSRS